MDDERFRRNQRKKAHLGEEAASGHCNCAPPTWPSGKSLCIAPVTSQNRQRVGSTSGRGRHVPNGVVKILPRGADLREDAGGLLNCEKSRPEGVFKSYREQINSASSSQISGNTG